MKDVQVDLMGGGNAQGAIATGLMQNQRLNVGRMRPWEDNRGNSFITIYQGGNPNKKTSWKTIQTNATATLRRDEWKSLDAAILKVGENRLNGIQDLISKGLTYDLGNAMGTTVLEWHDVGDAMEANLTMDGITQGQGDRIVFQHNYLPIPIIHVDYEINARVLEASRSLGNPVDTISAERAARKVALKLEQMLFTNITYSFGAVDSRSRNSIYSYINHPDRNTVTLSTYGNWANESATTPAEIVQSVRAMKQASMDAFHYGDWTLYIPSNFESRMDDDYDTSGASTQTIRERILKLEGIKEVKVVDTLPASNVVLVEMDSETVRLVRGLGLTNVEEQANFQFVTKYRVMTIQVPQIRSDQDGNSGLVHMS